ASSSVQVTKSTDSVTLEYTGGGPPGYSFAIALSASGVTTQSSTIAPLIASIGGSSVTSLGLNGTISNLTLTVGEAGSTRTYTPALSSCTSIAAIGSLSGSGASATLPVNGGTIASASGCTLTITDSGGVALQLPITNTPVSATVTVNGTQISEYGGYSAPFGITKGPDGNIWFTDQGTQEVEAFNPASLAIQSQYATGASLWDLATGSDGALWVADQSNGGALRMTTAGIATQYPFSGTPQGIAAGPNGLMLIADNTSGGVWTLDAGGLFTILPFSPSGTPAEVTWVPGGTSGDAWFAEGPYVGDFSLNNNTLTSEISVPDGDSATYLAYGPDGNVWVSASGGTTPLMLVINPATDTISHQVTLPAGAHPNGVVAGKDNAMWFVDSGNNAVGEIAISSYAVTEYPLISAGAQPREITVGPDGSLWLTEYAVGNIARVIP
ncbi:MAG TPA: hypothetical protein VMG98_05830, partial [Verrucomicrobiae bacterium]|nr:hypothetical protein [Verrucomicrobiae bacterium]